MVVNLAKTEIHVLNIVTIYYALNTFTIYLKKSQFWYKQIKCNMVFDLFTIYL